MNITCPICQDSHTVSKVSGIADAGTVRGTLSGPTAAMSYTPDGKLVPTGGYTTLNNNSSTILAQKVKLKQPPELPDKKGCFWWVFWVGIVGMVLFGLMNLCVATSADISGGHQFIMIVILIGYWYFIISNKNKKIKKQAEEYEALLPIYNEYNSIWNRCYYCQKDDIVFDPETGKYGAPGTFPKYL